MSHIIPALVCKLAYAHEAWIVGSAATPDCNHANVRDYDVLVPMDQWRKAAMLIPLDATPNTFGGWKCQSEGREVDVWPGDLGWLMTNYLARWAWHPRTNTRISSHNDDIINNLKTP
jgi:hypothetical protein